MSTQGTQMEIRLNPSVPSEGKGVPGVIPCMGKAGHRSMISKAGE